MLQSALLWNSFLSHVISSLTSNGTNQTANACLLCETSNLPSNAPMRPKFLFWNCIRLLYTRGGFWPRNSQNITNLRMTFRHRPLLDLFPEINSAVEPKTSKQQDNCQARIRQELKSLRVWRLKCGLELYHCTNVAIYCSYAGLNTAFAHRFHPPVLPDIHERAVCVVYCSHFCL
jgi:hypothetical protein